MTIGNPSKEAETSETLIKLLPGNVRGNYDRALTARDQMLVESFDEATGHTHVRQLEYTLDESQRTALANKERRCYAQALQGLAEHQRQVIGQDGRVFTLMTAGWTVKGLQASADPAKFFGAQGQNVATEKVERWSYYSVLDAVGYDTLKEDQLPQIDRFREQENDGTRTPMPPKIIEDAELLSLLRARTKENNVVTEHNLDTLSVLNHALQNKDALGLDNAEELEAWRNSLISWP